jgi:general secretion pathway protein A
MFATFYQLSEQPFGMNPDPRFLYLSKSHREAFSSLLYGISSDCGFLEMIAQAGMGKTTLIFHLLEQLRSVARTAFIFQTQCSSQQLIRYLLAEFDCKAKSTDRVKMLEEINRVLITEANAGRRTVLVIDEAQNLDADVLETVRLLSDFETPRRKLLQIVLSGQPELESRLGDPSLYQMRQRVSIIARINQLTPGETISYISHRLNIAGCKQGGAQLFTQEALSRIACLSAGVPRVINNFCFNALSIGCATREKQINASIIDEVARDLGIDNHAQPDRNLEVPSQEKIGIASAASAFGAAVATSRKLELREDKCQLTDKTQTHDSPKARLAFAPSNARHATHSNELTGNSVERNKINSEELTQRKVPLVKPQAVPKLAPNDEGSKQGIIGEKKNPILKKGGKITLVAMSVVALYVAVTMLAPRSRDPAKQSSQAVEEHAPSNPQQSAPYSNSFSGADIPEVTGNHDAKTTMTAPVDHFRSPRTALSDQKALTVSRSRSQTWLDNTADLAEPALTVVDSVQDKLPLHAIPLTDPKITAVSVARPESVNAPANFVPAKVLKKRTPIYPPVAAQLHVEGEVALQVSVSNTGRVQQVRLLKGNTLLAAAAKSAAEEWEYLPARMNGKAVYSQEQVIVKFRLQ